jgi:hypothetical protein
MKLDTQGTSVEDRMVFVNEVVPATDVVKYGLPAVNKEFLVDSATFEWTVDRDADVYLRWMGYDWQDPTEQKFSLYWKGHLLRITLRATDVTGTRGGAGSIRWTASKSAKGGRIPLPPALEAQRADITADLKAALTAFRSAGLRTAYATFTTHFGF